MNACLSHVTHIDGSPISYGVECAFTQPYPPSFPLKFTSHRSQANVLKPLQQRLPRLCVIAHRQRHLGGRSLNLHEKEMVREDAVDLWAPVSSSLTILLHLVKIGFRCSWKICRQLPLKPYLNRPILICTRGRVRLASFDGRLFMIAIGRNGRAIMMS